MRRAIPLALALGATLLHADGLGDLRAALRGLPPAAKVRLKVESDSRSLEDGKHEATHRSTTLEDGPEGTRILEDSHPSLPAKKGAVSLGAQKKGSRDFQEILHPSEGLLELLEKARLLEDRPDTWEGRPARRLKLGLDLDLDPEARSHVKQAVHEATVWLGADHLPLAMDQHLELKLRVLLLANIWTKVDITRKFQRAQNRLLVLEEQAKAQGTAMGKAFSSLETTRCTLLP
jgi:hypothetical protein